MKKLYEGSEGDFALVGVGTEHAVLAVTDGQGNEAHLVVSVEKAVEIAKGIIEECSRKRK